MGYALGLPDALRRRGLRVEVVPGWETRSAGSFHPKGAVAHWTAGPRGTTTRPSLNVVVNGRPDLPGPLCNVYGARDGVAVVVAAGRANHAGTGGWRGLVGNSAVFGTEMEGADAADFTPAQRWSYPRIHAAYCDLGGFGPEMNCGHSEWAGPRKVDINGYTPDVLRRDIAAVLNGDDDMPTAKEIVDELLSRRVPTRLPQDVGRTVPLLDVLTDTQLNARSAGQQVWGYDIPDPDKATRTGDPKATTPAGAILIAGAGQAQRAAAGVAAAVQAQDPKALAAAIAAALPAAQVEQVAAQLSIVAKTA